MKKNLLALTCSILSFAAFSQQDSLLKNFKFRIDSYQAVNMHFDGSSQYNRAEPPIGARENSVSSGGIGVSYYTVQSSDKILSTLSAGFSSSFVSSKGTSSGNKDRSSTFSVMPNLRVLNKWFSKNNFIELGGDGSANFRSNKNVEIAYKNSQGQYTLQLNTGIGKGRLENVTDMQNAIWLSKTLQAENCLNTPLSSVQLNELGRAITRANNTRVLDSRRRTRFILATVDGYLQQQGLINKTDINYFSNLNDILFFAFNTQRLSGTEKFIRFTPIISGSGINQSQYGSIDKFENRFTNKSLVLSTGISKYIPTNLTHQNNYGASLKLYYISGDATLRFFDSVGGMNEIKSNSIARQAGINLFYDHAIYPNTRTIITFSFRSEYGYTDEEQQHGFYGSTNLYGELNYFISYRTRFTCNFGAEYQRNVYEYTWLYANAGVQISL